MYLIRYKGCPSEIVEVKLNSSKSISNRLLILKHLTKQNFVINNLSNADDTNILKDCLKSVAENTNNSEYVMINAGNAGTSFRFLLSLLAITPGKWILTGSERMRERPVKVLVDALIDLGSDIQYISNEGYPPIRINEKKLNKKNVEISTSVSSQYISSLLLIAPFLPEGLTIRLKDSMVSQPYINMTLELLKHIGANYSYENQIIDVKAWNNVYNIKDYFVEPDWSSAAYWYQIVAFSNRLSLKLKYLQPNSIQGDRVISEIFKSFGVSTKYTNDGIIISKEKSTITDFYYDFVNSPDLAQTIAVTCAGLRVNARLSGLQTLKIKETNRLNALFKELKKTGLEINIHGDDSIEIIGKNFDIKKDNILIKSYNDHRMIMSFAPLAILTGEIYFNSVDQVSKSYPDFWNEAKKVGFEIEEF